MNANGAANGVRLRADAAPLATAQEFAADVQAVVDLVELAAYAGGFSIVDDGGDLALAGAGPDGRRVGRQVARGDLRLARVGYGSPIDVAVIIASGSAVASLTALVTQIVANIAATRAHVAATRAAKAELAAAAPDEPGGDRYADARRALLDAVVTAAPLADDATEAKLKEIVRDRTVRFVETHTIEVVSD